MPCKGDFPVAKYISGEEEIPRPCAMTPHAKVGVLQEVYYTFALEEQRVTLSLSALNCNFPRTL